MTIHKDVCERMHEALDSFPDMPSRDDRGRVAAAAKLLNAMPQTVRRWLRPEGPKGLAMPDATRFPEICKQLNVNIQWMLSGEGPKRPEHYTDGEPIMLRDDVMADVARLLRHSVGNFTQLEYSKQGQLINYLYRVKFSSSMTDDEIISALNSGVRPESAQLTLLVKDGLKTKE